MSALQAVLFDMDGTLVETETMWHDAESMTMQRFGAEWTREEQLMSMGGPFDKVAEYMANKIGVSAARTGEEMIANISELMRTRPMTIQPGIAELHASLRAAGIPIALVTNSFRPLLDLVIARTGLQFDVTVTSDEVEQGKPFPDSYLKGCALLGVNPACCVVLEDSRTGIQAATAAGAHVVAIPPEPVARELTPTDRITIVHSATEINLDFLYSLVR